MPRPYFFISEKYSKNVKFQFLNKFSKYHLLKILFACQIVIIKARLNMLHNEWQTLQTYDKGPFNNYVYQILPNFDPLSPSRI